MDIRFPSVPDERARILVVEPNRTNLSVLARRLVEAGYRASTADSAPAAVAELHRQPIDLVLAELNMPRMTGADLARADPWRGELARHPGHADHGQVRNHRVPSKLMRQARTM